MTAGAKPQPTALRVLRGNPGKRPLPKNEPQPALAFERPAPPSYLEGDAAAEWNRVVGDLVAMRMLATCDANVLAAYCVAFARWRAAERELAVMSDDRQCGLVVWSDNGRPQQNPLIVTARNAAADMVRYAAEFGLTPSARARLAAGAFADEGSSKFSGLLA